ncbi:MAG: carboxypeptidase-like regulatory domain-containing protein [Bacteroidetes bacterium]|nr:carboxypeptidase-like regulatory domain-containing protein [Bacteroidota bacterium]
MRIVLFIASLFFVSVTVNAQQGTFMITGKVLNADTKQPMVSASVFAENTTIGTATDAEGNFKLALPNGGYELVVTFTGFTTETKRINTSDATNTMLLFELKQKEKELQAVAIVASNEVKNGLEIYGQFFTDQFIGKTTNSKSCSIKNKEVLKFYFSKKRNRLKVMAAEPLIIENNALGYTIKYALDSFTHEYASQVSLYTGNPLFEEMTAADAAQEATWKKARQEAYKGSILHFMRSVYNKQLKEEGFEVQYLADMGGRDTALKLKNFYTALNYQKNDSLQTVEIKPNQNRLGVIYSKEKPAAAYLAENELEPVDFEFSILGFLAGHSITIEQNGYFFEQNDLSISEYWTWERMADQVPYDYAP